MTVTFDLENEIEPAPEIKVVDFSCRELKLLTYSAGLTFCDNLDRFC
jgi:hypothetical protein